MKHLDEENNYEIIMRLILKNLVPIYDVINAKLGQKGTEFVHYVPTMIEKKWKEQFHKRIIHQKYLLLLIFILPLTLLHEIPIWIFLTHFWVVDATTESQKLKILK